MPHAAEALRHISGGRVLDVATGSGGFVQTLIDGLASFDEFVGIDADESLAVAFADAFRDRPNVRFLAMDAMRPTLEDASFDTVAISNSLHHFADAPAILERMLELLRPRGHFVVSEMYRSNQSAAQVTHVLLHHWAAEIDTMEGIVHRRTFTRQQLVRLVSRLSLSDLRLTDISDTADPHDPDTVAQIDGVIDRHLTRAAGHPQLEAKGSAIRRRLHRVGIHAATTLMATGRKC